MLLQALTAADVGAPLRPGPARSATSSAGRCAGRDCSAGNASALPCAMAATAASAPGLAHRPAPATRQALHLWLNLNHAHALRICNPFSCMTIGVASFMLCDELASGTESSKCVKSIGSAVHGKEGLRSWCTEMCAQMLRLHAAGDALGPALRPGGAAVWRDLREAAALRKAPLPRALPLRALPRSLPPARGQELRLRPHPAPHALLPAAQVPMPSEQYSAFVSTWAQAQLSCKVQGGQVSPLSNPGAKFAETAELRGQVREALHSHQELRAAPVQAPLLRWHLPTLRPGADLNCKRSYDCYSITILRSSSLPSAPFASCCQAKLFHS